MSAITPASRPLLSHCHFYHATSPSSLDSLSSSRCELLSAGISGESLASYPRRIPGPRYNSSSTIAVHHHPLIAHPHSWRRMHCKTTLSCLLLDDDDVLCRVVPGKNWDNSSSSIAVHHHPLISHPHSRQRIHCTTPSPLCSTMTMTMCSAGE